MSFRFSSFAGLAAAALAAALLAGCAEAPPQAAAAPPQRAPAVTMSPKLIELASAYRGYVTRATAITPAFSNGESIARSLETGVAYEPNQLLRGAIAYSAVAALQDKAFVEGVRTYAKDQEQRRQVAYSILKDPAYAVGFPGSASAAGLIVSALGGEGQRLYDEGKAVKQAAYDIQRQPWSKADVQGRDQRLQQAKQASAAPMSGDVDETARLQQASTGAGALNLTAASAAPPYSPTVVRGLAVAALAVLGEAGDANLDQIYGVMAEPNVGSCMTMSKLMLYQCLAVARPHYEDVFCLGQHAMMDTGRCVIKAAGLPEPYEARFVPDAKSIARGMVIKKPPPKKKTSGKS